MADVENSGLIASNEKNTHKFKAISHHIQGVPVPMMPTLLPCKVFPNGAGGIWTPSKPRMLEGNSFP